ncbi:MAG: cupin domain-containing protein [bacterium]
MIIKQLENIEKIPVNIAGAVNAFKQIAIGSNDNTPSFALRVFTLEPNGETPYHTHGFEHINYIIDGEGFLVDAEGNEKPIKKGDFALILPMEKHQFKNASQNNNFVMICGVPKEYE